MATCLARCVSSCVRTFRSVLSALHLWEPGIFLVSKGDTSVRWSFMTTPVVHLFFCRSFCRFRMSFFVVILGMRSLKLLPSMSVDPFGILKDGQPRPGAVYKFCAQDVCLWHGRDQVSEVSFGTDREFVGSLGYGSALRLHRLRCCAWRLQARCCCRWLLQARRHCARDHGFFRSRELGISLSPVRCPGRVFASRSEWGVFFSSVNSCFLNISRG